MDAADALGSLPSIRDENPDSIILSPPSRLTDACGFDSVSEVDGFDAVSRQQKKERSLFGPGAPVSGSFVQQFSSTYRVPPLDESFISDPRGQTRRPCLAPLATYHQQQYGVLQPIWDTALQLRASGTSPLSDQQGPSPALVPTAASCSGPPNRIAQNRQDPVNSGKRVQTSRTQNARSVSLSPPALPHQLCPGAACHTDSLLTLGHSPPSAPPPQPFTVSSEITTCIVLPTVTYDWYRGLLPVDSAMLDNAMRADVSSLLTVKLSQVRILGMSEDTKGVNVTLGLSGQTASEAEKLAVKLDTFVEHGLLTLTEATRALQELGWFTAAEKVAKTDGKSDDATSDRFEQHTAAMQQQRAQQKEFNRRMGERQAEVKQLLAEQARVVRLEKTGTDLKAHLENRRLSEALAAAEGLYNDYPCTGPPVLCNALHDVFPELTIQDISVRWRSIITEYCREGDRPLPAKKDLARALLANGGDRPRKDVERQPLKFSALNNVNEGRLLSREATKVFEQHLEDRRRLLHELKTKQSERSPSPSDRVVTVFEGKSGKVILSAEQSGTFKQPTPAQSASRLGTSRTPHGSHPSPVFAIPFHCL
ncbi:hypothetical protein DIPPA_08864 [Diplonema papillatum]|nr:hypothetical protein DIPPA_08864 [Diplonema papillatum]